LKKINVLILIILFLYILIYPVSIRQTYIYSLQNELALMSYVPDMDSILSSLELSRIWDKRFLFSIIRLIILFDMLVFSYFTLYSYQRKNQGVLDKRKYILKLFPYYFEGNIKKWTYHLFYIRL